MSRMAGQFAGILKVGVEPQQYDDLIKALNNLSAHGIRMLLAESVVETSGTTRPISMQLVGQRRTLDHRRRACAHEQRGAVPR